MAAPQDYPKTLCPPPVVRILSAQLRNLYSCPETFFIAVPDPKDTRIWYFLIAGLDAPYATGEYIFYLIAPDEFPQKPPRLIFLTPNGLFTPGHKVCISVGEFHANDRPGKDGAHGWRPSLGMKGFANEVVNALICSDDLGSGIGIESSSPTEKRRLAKNSRDYNRRNLTMIYDLFEDQIKENPTILPIVNLLKARGCIMDAAAAAPVTAPVTAPVMAPVTAPVMAPVTAPVTAPVVAPVMAPVTTPVTAPVATENLKLHIDELDALINELQM